MKAGKESGGNVVGRFLLRERWTGLADLGRIGGDLPSLCVGPPR
jgi:hypothetical protein